MNGKKIVFAAFAVICVLAVAAVVFRYATSAPPVAQEPGWSTLSENGLTFQYPPQLPTTYMHAEQDWPPQLSLADGPFSCVPDVETTGAMRTSEKRVVNGRSYCVTTEGEGAAGSIYVTYAYSFPFRGRVALLRLTIREVQCDNYDDPKKTECRQERESFDLDSIVDRIAQTIH